MFATRLGRWLGLPTPRVEVIEVGKTGRLRVAPRFPNYKWIELRDAWIVAPGQEEAGSVEKFTQLHRDAAQRQGDPANAAVGSNRGKPLHAVIRYCSKKNRR